MIIGTIYRCEDCERMRRKHSYVYFGTDTLPLLLSIIFSACSTPVHDFHTVFHSLWTHADSVHQFSTLVDKLVENYMGVTCGRGCVARVWTAGDLRPE